MLVSVYLIPFRFALLRSARSCHLCLPPPHLHALAERRILLGLTPYSYECETSEDSSSTVVGPFHPLTPLRALESLAAQPWFYSILETPPFPRTHRQTLCLIYSMSALCRGSRIRSMFEKDLDKFHVFTDRIRSMPDVAECTHQQKTTLLAVPCNFCALRVPCRFGRKPG